jgi:hypothetical protein
MTTKEIFLDSTNQQYTARLDAGTFTQDICVKESGQYFCCIVVHDAQCDIVVHSDVVDVDLHIIVISYAAHQKNVRLSLDAHTDRDGVAVDMTLLSLVGEDGFVDIQWGIHMPVGVAKTQGRLLEDNIIFHPSARIKALPKLDIRSNDVQASHGAKIHTIDDKELFYMQARWLSLAASKKLYIQWYMQSLFATIPAIDPVFAQEQEENIIQTLAL